MNAQTIAPFTPGQTIVAVRYDSPAYHLLGQERTVRVHIDAGGPRVSVRRYGPLTDQAHAWVPVTVDRDDLLTIPDAAPVALGDRVRLIASEEAPIGSVTAVWRRPHGAGWAVDVYADGETYNAVLPCDTDLLERVDTPTPEFAIGDRVTVTGRGAKLDRVERGVYGGPTESARGGHVYVTLDHAGPVAVPASMVAADDTPGADTPGADTPGADDTVAERLAFLVRMTESQLRVARDDEAEQVARLRNLDPARDMDVELAAGRLRDLTRTRQLVAEREEFLTGLRWALTGE